MPPPFRHPHHPLFFRDPQAFAEIEDFQKPDDFPSSKLHGRYTFRHSCKTNEPRVPEGSMLGGVQGIQFTLSN